MKLEEIFERIGMSREQIVKATVPVKMKQAPINIDMPRPNCPVCGKRINAFNCAPIKTI